MKSKRSHEGYLFVDHRNSPGLSEEVTLAAGRPLSAATGLFEAPTFTCSHCQVVVVINPLRNRERAYCAKCDHYLCDACGVVKAQNGECRSMEQVFDEALEQAVLSQQSGVITFS
jgi:hypothetical protein